MLRTGNKNQPQSSEKGRACILHSLSLAFPEKFTAHKTCRIPHQRQTIQHNKYQETNPRLDSFCSHTGQTGWVSKKGNTLCTADTTSVSIPQNSELPVENFPSGSSPFSPPGVESLCKPVFPGELLLCQVFVLICQQFLFVRDRNGFRGSVLSQVPRISQKISILRNLFLKS